MNLFKEHRMALALLAASVNFAALNSAAADYKTKVVFSGLNRPTGIVAHGSGTVFVTQLPTPGVPGTMGGQNTVDRIQLASGRIDNLTTGEPEPTNLALGPHGLFWTCKSAGVILQANNRGDVRLFLGGLTQPSGIDVDKRGLVYFTQLPTPGVGGGAGGMNTVNVSDGNSIKTLTLGEPEPTDITVDRNGNAYWTCKSAGVILRRSKSGAVSLLLSGLMSPTGIAVDHQAKLLYFTQVPTPGVPGSAGGMNSVCVLNLATMTVEAVDFGDPEPTDITVAPNGAVFWTCSSAGVIVEARRTRK